MVEYSVLIGLITAATIGLVVLVGTWVNAQWQTLCDATSGGGTATCPY
jgi:pilus assembly protein Flp/PilA